MATYYFIRGNASIDNGDGSFDIVTGDNANSGTSTLLPKKDFSNVISTYSPTVSDDVYGSGLHVGSFTCPAKIHRWPGQGKFYICGSRDPIADGIAWAVSAGTTYRANIGAGKSVANVCAMWASRVDSSGRNYGWYAEGTVSAGELTADKRWDYVDPYLYIRDDDLFTGGVTPSTITAELDRVRWQDATLAIGLDHRSASHTEIDGVEFIHFCTRAGTSYGYFGGGDVAMRDCIARDCEIHGIVFSNHPNTNCTASSCEVWGAGTTSGYNAIVWHNGLNSTSGDVTGARGNNITLHLYSLLDHAGDPLDSSVSINGIYAHTYGIGIGGGTVDDALWTNVWIYHYENPGNPFSTADANTTVNDIDVWEDYPIRVLNGRVYNCNNTIYVQSNMAFRRCFFDTTQTSGRNPLAVGSAIFAVGSGFNVLLESCVHVTNSDDPSSGGRRIYYLLTGSALSQINCTTIDVSTAGSGYNHSMFQYQSAALFSLGSAGFLNKSRGSIFYFKTQHAGNYFAYFDGGVANTANYVFSGNWVYNVGAGVRWAENTSYDTQAEWQSVIDTNAVIGTSPLFVTDTSVDPMVAGETQTSSTIRTNTFQTGFTPQGYNNRLYSGARGAYQYGLPAGNSGQTVGLALIVLGLV